MSYKGGDRAEFGIVDKLDPEKDYGDPYEPKEYHCIAICDDALNDWWDELTEMKTYFHCLKRPDRNLARWGVTLIPPESLDILTEVIMNNTQAEYMSDGLEIIEVLKKAKAENKFIIHYGV
jgi:hypothetical protein